MTSEADEIRLVLAAAAERAELVAEQDALLTSTVAELLERTASPELSDDDLSEAARLADEWAALTDQRLELAAKEATNVGKIIAAAAASPTRWATVLRAQATQLEAIASGLHVTATLVDAGTELAEKVRL